MGEKGNVAAEAASLTQRAADAGGSLAVTAATKAVEKGVEAGVDVGVERLSRSEERGQTAEVPAEEDAEGTTGA